MKGKLKTLDVSLIRSAIDRAFMLGQSYAKETNSAEYSGFYLPELDNLLKQTVHQLNETKIKIKST